MQGDVQVVCNMNWIAEFFGYADNTRPIEGFMSWQHLTFVGCLLAAMTALAVFLGLRNKNADDKKKNTVLIWSAILIDAFEIAKIIIVCTREADPMRWLYDLPLFLCSIQLITIPLAAFSKGRIKEAAMDFVLIFGILGAVMGTIGAGNIYASNPVLSFDTVVSGITHSISGFTSLYIGFSGMTEFKRRNMPITFGVLGFFAIAAAIANYAIDYNYMFLRKGDGTPYDIFYNLVDGDPLVYPMIVIGLFVVYIVACYEVWGLILRSKRRQEALEAACEEAVEISHV